MDALLWDQSRFCRLILGTHQTGLIVELSKWECLKRCDHHLLTWTSTTSLCLRMHLMAMKSGAWLSPLKHVSSSEPQSIFLQVDLINCHQLYLIPLSPYVTVSASMYFSVSYQLIEATVCDILWGLIVLELYYSDLVFRWMKAVSVACPISLMSRAIHTTVSQRW